LNRIGGMRWLSPALVGLTLPFVITLFAFPVLVGEGRVMIELILFMVMILAVAAYAVTVIRPGVLSGFIIDEKTQTLTLVREGPFANKTEALYFDEIANLRQVTRYDDDGYAALVTELVTKYGQTVELPIGLSKTDVEAGRRALGLMAEWPAR
jgi:hypothetical protein